LNKREYKRESKKDLRKDGKEMKKRAAGIRQKNIIKYQLPKDLVIDYKNITLLQKYLNERGKVVPRRISGISAKLQRKLCSSIKKARFLALLPSGGVKE